MAAEGLSAWLVIGLGNPGPEYAGTRHNIGFNVIDDLSADLGASYWKDTCGAKVAKVRYEGMDVVLAKPQTFMNRSGRSCSKLIDSMDMDVSHVIVIQDDLDLPIGDLRIKGKGGHGGHNGIRSIIECIGDDSFIRVKVGIGRPTGRMSVSDYVLSKPRKADAEELDDTARSAADAVLSIIANGLQLAQTEYNGRR